MVINVEEKQDKTYVLCPEGNLDYVTSSELEQKVNEVASLANKMVIDLSKIEYIASAGLRVLVLADELMKQKGGMVIANMNDYVSEILKMTGFDSELTIEK